MLKANLAGDSEKFETYKTGNSFDQASSRFGMAGMSSSS